MIPFHYQCTLTTMWLGIKWRKRKIEWELSMAPLSDISNQNEISTSIYYAQRSFCIQEENWDYQRMIDIAFRFVWPTVTA